MQASFISLKSAPTFALQIIEPPSHGETELRVCLFQQTETQL